jgi:invasion protein IalB
MRVMRGVQLSIDDDALGSANFETCLPNGCMADFEVTPELVARLKSGAQLRLEGIKVPNNLVRYLFSLADFAAANEGPPTDPARFEQDQRQRNAPPPPSQSPPSQPK